MKKDIEMDEIDEAVICRSRNNLIYSSQLVPMIAVTIIVTFFAVMIHKLVDLHILIAWSSSVIISYVVRYVLRARYIQQTEEEKGHNRWERYFTYSTAFSGFLWGAGAYVTFSSNSPSYQTLYVLIILILCSGSTVTHSAYRWAASLFSACCLVPLIVLLFVIEQEASSILGVFLFLFLLVMLSSGTYLWRMSNRMFMLSYENAKLADELTESNAELTDNLALLNQAKQELSDANVSLQRLASTDALTNLTNRRTFEALIQVKWERCSDEHMPLSLLLINVDLFKQYNDFYGQRRGDHCLVKISDFLSQMPEINRQGDSVARYNGDQFAVLLTGIGVDLAKSIAENIRQQVELLRISQTEMPNELSPWMSVSIGCSTEVDFDGSTFDELFESAERALNQAKRQGRNCIYHHSASAA